MPRDRPAWLAPLVQANESTSWLDAIANCEDSAVQGLLRRHGLRESNLRTERVDEVQAALGDGRLSGKDLADWREDILAVLLAVEGIADFRRKEPLAQAFCQANGLTTGTLDEMEGRVRDALWRGDLPRRAWVDFLDERRMETDRHLFLYRLPPDRQTELRRPGTAEDLLERLSVAKELVWKPASPLLTAAGLDQRSRRLELRWTGWRSWDRASPGGELERRCVTFLSLDLESGDVELQLQSHYLGGMKKLVAERDLYERLGERALGTRLERLRLEPAMRRLLSGDPHLTIESWRIRQPNGGEARARNAPDLFRKVSLAFQRFYVLELEGMWSAEDVSLPIRLDARTDGIEVNEQCQPGAVRGLVTLLRRYTVAAPALQAESPPSEDPRIAELQALIEKLVDYLRRLGHSEVAVDRLASDKATTDLLFNAKTLNEALGSIGVRYTGASFYILCPKTNSPVRQAGAVVEYERLDDVPPQVSCENESGPPQQHTTRGNIWLRIGPPAQSVTTSHYMLVGSGFGVLLFAATWAFVALLDNYTDPLIRTAINTGFVVALLGMLAAMIKIFGPAVMDLARKLLHPEQS